MTLCLIYVKHCSDFFKKHGIKPLKPVRNVGVHGGFAYAVLFSGCTHRCVVFNYVSAELYSTLFNNKPQNKKPPEIISLH